MARKSIKIKNKRFTLEEVPAPAEAVEDLLKLGYAKPFADSVGLVNTVRSAIIIADSLKGKEKDSTIFHEILHIISPKMAEKDVLKFEQELFPILYRYGLRFRK